MSRKVAREIAFQVVFSSNFQNENEEIENLINNLISEQRLKGKTMLNDEETVKEDVTSEDEKYIRDVACGVSKNVEELDEKIKTHLKGWTMERIGKTDLAVLRLALYEILYREDIPYKVSINEAVELAKLFCDDASPSFINGVLASVVNSFANDKE